jgi:hypothetical protein
LLALPDTTGFTRGNVYVIVDGSYGTKTLSTTTSGTSTITIRKANAGQDSGVTGYVSTLHDGTATFGALFVTTQYWIVDGITRTETNEWAAPAGYGISASEVRSSGFAGDDGDHSQYRYIDIGPAYTTTFVSGWGQPIYMTLQNDITFTRCALHNGVGALCQGSGSTNIVFEYCNIGPGWGKEALRAGNGGSCTGWIVRYCRFWDSSQTDPDDGTSGITAELGFWDYTGASTGVEVYGNWFYNSKTGGRNAVIVIGGDGSSWVGDGANGTKVYNNTFAGIADTNGTLVILNGTSTEAKNNLVYSAGSGFTASSSSNNVTASSDPFVSYSTRDYRIISTTGGTYPRNAGTNLGSPYDIDPLGVTRGGDGTWDVGAYEYNAGGSVPDAPSNFRLM